MGITAGIAEMNGINSKGNTIGSSRCSKTPFWRFAVGLPIQHRILSIAVILKLGSADFQRKRAEQSAISGRTGSTADEIYRRTLAWYSRHLSCSSGVVSSSTLDGGWIPSLVTHFKSCPFS